MAIRGAPAGRRVRYSLATLCALLVFASVAAPASAADHPTGDSPIGVHSMLFLSQPFTAKQAMFQQAAALGASTIRLDIELSGVFVDRSGPPDWSGVDQYMSLARRYHLNVLADLTATPWYMTDCPPRTAANTTYRCAPSDPKLWGRQAGLIAAHTRGVIDDFEIINEPDGAWAFLGSPQQYAAILSASYDAIHAADPKAQVALGGLMDTGAAGAEWMDAVLAAPGVDARHKFDIANIHARTTPSLAGGAVCKWRRYFAKKAFAGPLWVTETGYPADPSEQTDRGYEDGAASQARYITQVIPAMIAAGAGKVFATERDAMTGRYASEGVLSAPDPLPALPSFTRRPSFYAVRSLADGAWRADARRYSTCPM
jgi:hypothetical protein